MKTTLYYDAIYVEHNTGMGHPERGERLAVAMGELERSGLLDQLETKSPRDALREEIELVHSPSYVDLVRRVAESGGGHLDMDTALSSSSYDAALRAAGALLESVDRILSGEIRSAFCLVRPPGHHALPSRGMGFCLFNNVAVAAKYAIRRKGLEKVMIIDWDAHHGNGTQDMFYDDPSVLYVSLHQYPHYPGTGWVDEVGSGQARGTTINFPFPPGTGEDIYLSAFEEVIIPAGKKFDPDFIMISAGYDGHALDLLCSMRLIDSSYRKMTDMIVDMANGCCGGRIIVTLEGGYNLEAQARSIVQTISGLLNVDIEAKDAEPPKTAYPDKALSVIEQAKSLHS